MMNSFKVIIEVLFWHACGSRKMKLLSIPAMQQRDNFRAQFPARVMGKRGD